MVPSVMGIVYSWPVRLSVTVRKSCSVMKPPRAVHTLQSLTTLGRLGDGPVAGGARRYGGFYVCAIFSGFLKIDGGGDLAGTAGAAGELDLITQHAVQNAVVPAAIPEARPAQHTVLVEPGLLQCPLLGDVGYLRRRLDPVDLGVGEQVAHQQPLRPGTRTLAAGLRQQPDADFPAVGDLSGGHLMPVHEADRLGPAGHHEHAAHRTEQAVLVPPLPVQVRVAPAVPLLRPSAHRV